MHVVGVEAHLCYPDQIPDKSECTVYNGSAGGGGGTLLHSTGSTLALWGEEGGGVHLHFVYKARNNTELHIKRYK